MKRQILAFINYIKSLLIHFGYLSLLVIPILVIINWSYFSVVSSEKQAIKSQQIAIANEKINMIDFVFEQVISSTHNDLHVIRDASEMELYLSNPSNDNLNELEQLLYRIATNKPEFLCISLVALNGEELIRIEQIQSDLTIIDSSNLVNHSSDNFFAIAQTLNEDELYISPLAFLVKDNDLLSPQIPSTKFILGVYDNSSTQAAILVIDYDANDLLNVFSQYDQGELQAIELGLINQDLIWTINNETSSYFLVSKEITEEQLALFANPNDSTIIKDIDIERSIIHNTYNDEGFFKLYALINFNQAYRDIGSVIVNHTYIIVLLNLFILSSFLYLGGVIKKNSDGRILLNARMYLSDKNIDGVIITDENKLITYTNQAFQDIYGYEISEVKGKTPFELIGTIDIANEELENMADAALEKNRWHRTKHEVYILKNVRIRKEKTNSGKTKHYLAIYSEPQIDLDDYFSLTNTLDKTLDLLTSVYQGYDILESRTFIMVLKLFNHKNNFSKFLRSNLSSNYIVSVPKDGYVIIYNNATKKTLNQQISLIDNLFETYKYIELNNINIEYRLGIAIADINTKNHKVLLDNALIALEMSETQKNIKYLIYNNSIRDLMLREKEIKLELENGFNQDEFFINYQIQKDIETNKYTGVEALLRWNNKRLGNIPPNEFIPIIENTYYVNNLSIMVVKKVIRDFEPYLNRLDYDFRISINLTSFDFTNNSIIREIINIIEKSGISPRHFCFEITESGYLENINKTNLTIDLLHEKGFIIAIDDFGTGFSSINSLKAIKVDKVKIDREFIKDYPEKDDGSTFAIMANLIKNLKLKIVVEGTETLEQINFAKSNLCQEIQGYYISRPLSITDFIDRFYKQE